MTHCGARWIGSQHQLREFAAAMQTLGYAVSGRQQDGTNFLQVKTTAASSSDAVRQLKNIAKELGVDAITVALQ